MSANSRYIRVHQDALVEWIQDDNFFYEDEYSIVKDTLNTTTTFSFSKNAVNADNWNKIPNQLYLIDGVINKFGVADPDAKPFLQEVKYANNAPSRFDKVKIWFPINWSFSNLAGMYMKIWTLNYDNSAQYALSAFYLDATNPTDINKLTTESDPLRLYERLWGKSITIYVPSVSYEASLRTLNSPTLGSINYSLTSGQLGLSTTAPIFMDFRYLRGKETVLGQVSFYSNPPLVTSLPQSPEYNNLSVEVKEATDGDYFTINGIYNGNVSEFDQFMTMLDSVGKRSYVLYSITRFEEGIAYDTQEVYVYKDFFKPIIHKPVFMFTSTTGSLQVQMKLINSVDGSVTNKLSDFTMTGSTLGKYGKIATPINISGAIKPKLYNSKPDNNVLPGSAVINYQLKKKTSGAVEIKYIPYPVLTNIANVVTNQVTNLTKGENYFGLGGLELSITPFDNVIKIRVSEKQSEDLKPMKFPSSGSAVQLVFKSVTFELRVPLYMESNEVDLINGVLVFKILSSQYPTLKKIYETNTNFYITITTNSTETSIYDGKFTLLEETPRPKTEQQSTAKPEASKPLARVAASNFTLVENSSQALVQLTQAVPVLSDSVSTQKRILAAGLSFDQLRLIK